MFESQLTISVITTKTDIMFYIKMCESGGFALLKKDPAPRRRGIFGVHKKRLPARQFASLATG
jgi:hypothetical protein